MRVLFVSANTETVNMRALPFGLWCVATAVEQAGHQVFMVDLADHADPEAALAAALEEARPEVIGLSVRNIDDQCSAAPVFFLDRVRPVVEQCRRLSAAPVVLGGAGYSLFPVPALEFLRADFGIQGEGELAFVALLDALRRGSSLAEVPGLYRRGVGRLGVRRFVADLDRLPLPAARFLDNLPAPTADGAGPPLWVPVQMRRGCSMGCSYCSTATIEGDRVRSRSVGSLLAWLADRPALRRYPLYFVDNNFNLPPQPAHELCRGLEEMGAPFAWRCILHPHGVDSGLVQALARAGCREVSLGFESGSEKILEGMHKRFTPDEVRRTAGLLAEAGIRSMGFLLLGGPGETLESAEESLRFAASLPLAALRVTVGIRIYPDTELARLAVAEGLLSPIDDLLRPRFYLVPGLGPPLRELVKGWAKDRPSWIT